MNDSDFTAFVRRPFSVLAVQLTKENITKIAPLVGEVRMKDGEPYIALDKRIVPNVGRAFIGWYVTRLGENLRCYSPKVFKEQFMPMPDEDPVTFTHEDLAMEETSALEPGEFGRIEIPG